MHSMKIKRPLPPAPKITTKTVRNDTMRGYGTYTYESPFMQTAMDLRIPPTRSNSQAAERERELKAILDLAREGKTATEISEATGCSKVRISQTINRFAEYGAKLTPEKPKKRKRATTTGSVWTDDMIEQLVALHREGLTFSQIGAQMGVSKNSVTAKIRGLIMDGVLESRMSEITWSAEDVDRMFQLRAEGKTWGEISDKLGRKITSCHNKYCREMEKRKCQKE